MRVMVSLKHFRGFQILGKEEEIQLKRDIQRKLSRAFRTKRPIARKYVVIQTSQACSQGPVTYQE